MAYNLITGKQGGRNWARESSLTTSGSLLLPAGQQKALFGKIDDIRYDVRRASAVVAASLVVLTGGFVAVALASVFRTARKWRERN